MPTKISYPYKDWVFLSTGMPRVASKCIFHMSVRMHHVLRIRIPLDNEGVLVTHP